MSGMITIGTDKETVEATRAAIMEILNARADQKTIRLALRALRDGITPRDITISHCLFTSGQVTKETTKTDNMDEDLE